MIDHVIWCSVAVFASMDAMLALSLLEWWLSRARAAQEGASDV